MKTRVDVHGLDDVSRLLKQIAPNHAANIIRATVHDVAKELRDDARSEMPDDEGTMIAATKHRRERFRFGVARSTVRVGREAFYWRFLEYGQGPDRIAHDFFYKALQMMRGKLTRSFLSAFGRKFEAALKRARKRQ